MKISLEYINTFHLISFLFLKQTFPSLYYHKSIFFFGRPRDCIKSNGKSPSDKKLTIYDIDLLFCFSRDLHSSINQFIQLALDFNY